MTPGAKAWVGMSAGIAGYDAFAIVTGRDTMSAAFECALRHPVRKWPVILAWAFVTAHLFGWMGAHDPLRVIFRA